MMTNELQQRVDQFDNGIEDVIDILDTYLKLHESKVGAHWLWCAIERIVKGECQSEFDVLWDYGYVYRDDIEEYNK